ncbi:MAG: hypothetical protein ACK4N5_00865 [Myxococcales bacterium]
MFRCTVKLALLAALALGGCEKKPEPAPAAPPADAEGRAPSTDEERGAITRAIAQRFPELQECVQAAPEAERPGNEPVEVKFRVNPDGKADQIEVKSENRVAVDCFEKWIAATEFPKPSRSISVSFPYQFR